RAEFAAGIVAAQLVGQASRLSGGRLVRGPGNAGQTPHATGETPAPLSEQLTGIFAFPGGAKPGTCLHKILEKLEFTQWNQPPAAALVREQLRAHGLPEA